MLKILSTVVKSKREAYGYYRIVRRMKMSQLSLSRHRIPGDGPLLQRRRRFKQTAGYALRRTAKAARNEALSPELEFSRPIKADRRMVF
jgi:hypothetical protein